jgi:tRNA A37 threonylcarbamoyladenosine modification protein TsaB
MLTLGISTSLSNYAVALGEGGTVLYNSRKIDRPTDDQPIVNPTANRPDSKRVELLLTQGLQTIGRNIKEIGGIVVDNGPGGTSSVRTGVAFANGLGYSLGIGVASVSAFTLLGYDLYLQHKVPILLTAKSIKGNAFWGYFNHERLESLSYGMAGAVLPQIVQEGGELMIASSMIDNIQNILPRHHLCWSDQKTGDIEIMIRHRDLIATPSALYPQFVTPITETHLVYE